MGGVTLQWGLVFSDEEIEKEKEEALRRELLQWGLVFSDEEISKMTRKEDKQ